MNFNKFLALTLVISAMLFAFGGCRAILNDWEASLLGNTTPTQAPTEAPTTAPTEAPTAPIVPPALPLTTGTLAMPKTSYGYVGETFVVYFQNITNYDLSTHTVYLDASVQGQLHADRWEYTPTEAGSFQFQVAIMDVDGKCVSNEKFTVEVKNATQKDKLSVMIIGDSTIQAGGITQTLLDEAKADGYTLTLVGTQGSGVNKHEGRNGWTTTGYVTKEKPTAKTNLFYSAQTGKFDFTYYMNTHQKNSDGSIKPLDVVVIQLGINDLASTTTASALTGKVTTYLSNLEFMANSIHAYDANIKVVFNLIIPSNPSEAVFDEMYGDRISAAQMKTNTYTANLKLLEEFVNKTNVYIYHANATLDAANNMSDAVHPKTEGYQQIGKQLYAFLRAIN